MIMNNSFDSKLFTNIINVVRDRFDFHISFSIDLIRLFLRQSITMFIMLIIIDFTNNTWMFYYDYVYIMVDVDFGVRNIDTMYVWHEQRNDDDNDPNNLFECDVIESNCTMDESDSRQSNNQGLDQSISFVELTVNKIYSYQSIVNLAVYIIVYLSHLNGFFAYVWANHSWLTLHLVIVFIQLIFLLTLSMVNVRMVIVLIFRIMLFIMSLLRSMELSNNQMIQLQRQECFINHELSKQINQNINSSNNFKDYRSVKIPMMVNRSTHMNSKFSKSSPDSDRINRVQPMMMINSNNSQNDWPKLLPIKRNY